MEVRPRDLESPPATGNGVTRATPGDSELAGLLRIAWEHGQAIAETIEGGACGRKV